MKEIINVVKVIHYDIYQDHQKFGGIYTQDKTCTINFFYSIQILCSNYNLSKSLTRYILL